MKGALTFLLAAFVAAALVMVVRDAAAPASVSAAARVAASTAPPAGETLAESPATSPAPETVSPPAVAAALASPERATRAATGESEPQVTPERPAAARQIEPKPAAEPRSRRVVATYFHGKVRCATCRKVEAYAREAIEEGFGREIAAGTVEFRAIDVEEPQNRHFITDYQLMTRSVVVSEEVGGAVTRWVRLDQVWALVGDRTSYLHYVQDAVQGYIEIR